MKKLDLSSKLLRLYEDFKQKPEYATLTNDQKEFGKKFFNDGGNLFLTGAAGTGKSFISTHLINFLIGNFISVSKTATTGVAAFNIGGSTVHSALGLGFGDEDVETIIQNIIKFKKVKERIRAMEVLFIDEVSMLKGSLLYKIDGILKFFKKSNQPFGGIKVLMCGDFCQLPPVFKGDEEKDYCFKSKTWEGSNIQTVNLKEVVRQKDSVFVKLLNDIRFGITDDLSLLEARIGATFPDGIDPVRIFCKNVDVSLFNQDKLQKISGLSKFYKSHDQGEKHHIDAFNKNCPAPQTLELKVGAQVMLLVNLDTSAGLVNGSIGVVKGFSPEGVIVQFKTEKVIVSENTWQIKEQDVGLNEKLIYKVKATRVQIPLKVAYAITVHKSQAATLDHAIIDMSEAFESGQVYTALSRVRNLESLSIVDFPKSKIRVNKDCLDFYKNLNK